MAKERSSTSETIACQVCLKEIPKSVAHSHEGSDYVLHFCGDACYAQWQEAQGMHAIGVRIDGVHVDFETARNLARALALHHGNDAMLIAWYDRKQDRASPEVQECTGDKPGWLAYAESHGGDIRVDINGGEYVFVFTSNSEAA